MVRLLGGSVLLLALGAPANAQSVAAAPAASVPGGSTATMTPMERAQRDADKVFYWVKLHGNTPAKTAPATTAKEPAASTAARPAGTTAPVANSVAAAGIKRPTPIVRTAEAPAAAAKEAAPAGRTAPETHDGKGPPVAPETPAKPVAEPPASDENKVEPPEAKEPTPPAATVPASPEPAPPAPAPSPAAPPAAGTTIEPADKGDAPQDADAVASTQALARIDTAARPDEPGERLQPITQPAPEFPPAVVRALRHGSVRVQFNVMPDGTVAAADVVSSSSPRLNPAALAAVAQWRFQPVARAQLAQVDLAFSID